MSTNIKISWGRLAAESAVIVVSILLAFAIDAWWADRQDRVEEQRLLRALKAEFELNVRELPFFITNHSVAAASADALIGSLHLADPDSLAVVRNSDVFQITSHNSFDPSSGAFDTMVQSGTISVIQNPAIREKLAEWPAKVDDATENEHLLRAVWGPRLNDILMRQVDFTLGDDFWDCLDRESEEVCSKNEVRLQPTLELIGHLVIVRDWAAEAARELELVENAAVEMVQLLERELTEH